MENDRNIHNENAYARIENVIIDTGQNKTTSLLLSKQNVTDGLKICGQILYKLQLEKKVPSFLKEQRLLYNLKKENCIICEIIHDFYFEEDKELLLAKECITQEGINTINSNISSSIYYTNNWQLMNYYSK